LNILQVVTDPDRRGAQVFALDLASALVRRGHDVVTVALGLGGTSTRLDVDVLGRGLRDPSALRALRTRMARADVTIAHGGSTAPACAVAGGGRHRPFVYRQISDSRFWAPTHARRLRVRLALARARLVIALSEFNRRELTEWIGVRDARIRVVPNGVPPESFTVPSEEVRRVARATLGVPDRPTIAFVGALVPEKGADRAIAHMTSLPPDAQLVIAGDGPERGRLEGLASTLASGRVHFLGSLGGIVPVYHAADVVTFPTRGGDAMPASLIEAALCGIPVVATAVGAITEIVLDGETGVIANDEGHAFAAAVGALLADPARRAAYGAAARAHGLERFSIEPVAAAYEHVLTQALDR